MKGIILAGGSGTRLIHLAVSYMISIVVEESKRVYFMLNNGFVLTVC